MADAGIDDILIAFPVYGEKKLARLQALRRRARVQISLDSVEVALGLGALGVASGDPVEVYVEVDTGLHRMGLAPGDATVELVSRLNEIEGISIVGLLTHAGHSYAVTSPLERRALVHAEVQDLLSTQRRLGEQGIVVKEISVGSTPSVHEEMRTGGVTEVRPGTYVFNDTTMIRLGVATESTCAAHIIATVISRPSADRFVVDAGTKCLTSDGVGEPGWIQIAGRNDLSMEFVNEEHGVGLVDPTSDTSLSIGDKLLLIPSHACPVINLFDNAVSARGEQVVGSLAISGRGKVQ